jgi:hypothetical protein
MTVVVTVPVLRSRAVPVAVVVIMAVTVPVL